MLNAKNGTFLFQRDFMDYHSDRFDDYSLMVFKDDKLMAVLPANKKGQEVHSHMGLTYGGLVLSNRIKLDETLAIYKELLRFLSEAGIDTLHIKLIPTIYQKVPADELEYLLFLTEATLTRVDASSVIEYSSRLRIQPKRMARIKKAKKLGMEIVEGHSFEPFWNEILIPNLASRYQTKPVHSVEEISLLASRFPKRIHQFNVMKDGEIVAGATVFETETVAKVQYISGNDDRQKLGSIDLLFEYLIQDRFVDKKFFDFGMSNENQGRNVNQGLSIWKESFGARTVACKFYKVATSNYTKLDNVLL